MAHVVYKSGLKKSMTAEQGVKLWQVLQNPSGLNDQQLTKLSEIQAVYLNWRTAPDDYIKENLEWIIPFALKEWLVNKKGTPTRPGTDAAWVFAKRWGLWEFGQPSLLVSKPTLAAHTPPAPALAINDQ